MSKARGIRISEAVEAEIIRKATRKGWSFNKYINWCITLGLRSHTKKE